MGRAILLALLVLLGTVASLPLTSAALPTAQLSAMADLCTLLQSHLGWNCSDNPCSWQFVVCNSAETSITRLLNGTGVPAMTLGVNLPSSIANLVDLEELTLRSQGWTGAIVPGLLTLQNLTKLDLYGNALTGALGTLQNPNLFSLNLGSNRFTGSFPSLNQVPLLQTLILSGNGFSGQILSNAFSSASSLNHLESADTQFSGSTAAFANHSWSTLILRGNNFDMCPAPTSTVSATTTCDFSQQGTCSGSCYASWSNCQTTTSDVTCVPPSSVPTTNPSSNVTVLPLAHCWTTNGTTGDVFALFGYDAEADVNATELIFNVTNGVVTSHPERLESGSHELSVLVKISNASLVVVFGFGIGEQQNLDPSDTSRMCPNSSIDFVVSYPATTDAANISSIVHTLYSNSLPYPYDSMSTRNYDAKRAAGDVEVTLQPGQSANPFLSASQLFSASSLPQNSATGPASGAPKLTSSVPTTGGPPPVDARPPGLTVSAKGAIGISISVGILIILVVLLIRTATRTHKLPTVSRTQHEKPAKEPKKKKQHKKHKRHHSSEQALVADPSSAEMHEEPYQKPPTPETRRPHDEENPGNEKK